MAITIDDFKRAFKGCTDQGRVDRLDQQITEALKALKKLASTLGGSGDRTHHDALVELVARFAQAKKLTNRAAGDIEALLQQIRRDTLAQVALAVAATKATRLPLDSSPAPVAEGDDVSLAESSQVSRAPVGDPHVGTTPTEAVPERESMPVRSQDNSSGDRKQLARGKIEAIEQKLRKLASDHGLATR